MNVDFNILHLTDLHAGQPKHANIYPHMCEGFFRDLDGCHEKSGPWDVLVFSGDLAFSGREKEYLQVEAFLQALYGRLRALGSDPLLVAVPGNHDLSRPTDKTSSAVMLLTSLSDLRPERMEQYWDGIVNNPASDARKTIESSFAEYSKWWAPYSKLLASPAKGRPAAIRSFTPGLLPGEFLVTIEKAAPASPSSA